MRPSAQRRRRLPPGAYRDAVTKKGDTPVIVTAVQMALHPTTAPLATTLRPPTTLTPSSHHTHHSGVPADAAIPAAAAAATGTHEHRLHETIMRHTTTTDYTHELMSTYRTI